MFHIPEDMNKFHLDDVYNYVSIILFLILIDTSYSLGLYLGKNTSEKYTKR